MKLFKSHEPNIFHYAIEMDWRAYWNEEEFGAVIETAGNARL